MNPSMPTQVAEYCFAFPGRGGALTVGTVQLPLTLVYVVTGESSVPLSA